MSSWSPWLSSLLNLVFGATLAAMVAAWVWLVVQLRQGKPLLGAPVVRTVPWRFATVVVAVISWFALIALVGFAYAKATGRPAGVPFGFTEQMFVITAVNGAALVVIPLLARLTSGARAADFGLTMSTAGESLRIGALAFLIVTWPVNLLNILCVALVRTHERHPLEEMVRGGLDLGIAYLAVVSAAVLAPAVEELLFRGLMQSWLEGLFRRWVEQTPVELADDQVGALPPQRTLPKASLLANWMPIVITSAVFAAAHGAQWPAPIPIFVLSLVLGSVYQRTGNLLASFVLHALFNAFSTLLLFWAILHGAGSEAKAIAPPQSAVFLRSGAGAQTTAAAAAAGGERKRFSSDFFRLAHP